MNNIETNTSLESVLENKDQRKMFIDEIELDFEKIESSYNDKDIQVIIKMIDEDIRNEHFYENGDKLSKRKTVRQKKLIIEFLKRSASIKNGCIKESDRNVDFVWSAIIEHLKNNFSKKVSQ